MLLVSTREELSDSECLKSESDKSESWSASVHKKQHLLLKYFFLLLPFHKKNVFFQRNVLVKTCDRINVWISIQTFELKIQIIKHSRRPGITQKYCFQRQRSRKKSVFHDVYIPPKGTELSFPWHIYTSRGSSDWIVVRAYYGRIIITPGFKGLKRYIFHPRFFKSNLRKIAIC